MGPGDTLRERRPRASREVLEMARTVARYGGNYTSHAGSEGYEQNASSTTRSASPPRRRFRSTSSTSRSAACRSWGPIDTFIAQLEDGARARPRRHRQPVSLHGDVPRLERLLPAVDPRGRPGAVRRRASRIRRCGRGSRPTRTSPPGPRSTAAGPASRWPGPAPRRTASSRASGSREIATLRGDADPMDTCIDAHGGGGRQHQRHLPHDVGGRRAQVMRLPWVAVASDGSAINLDAPGRAPSAVSQHAPQRGGGDEAVNRHLAADVAEVMSKACRLPLA